MIFFISRHEANYKIPFRKAEALIGHLNLPNKNSWLKKKIFIQFLSFCNEFKTLNLSYNISVGATDYKN